MKENQVKYCQCNLCRAMAGTIWFHMTFHKTTISFDDAWCMFSHYPTALCCDSSEIYGDLKTEGHPSTVLDLHWAGFSVLGQAVKIVRSTVLVHGVHAHVWRTRVVKLPYDFCGVWLSHHHKEAVKSIGPFWWIDYFAIMPRNLHKYHDIAFDSVMFGSYLYNITSRCRYTIAAVDCNIHFVNRRTIFDPSRLPVAIPGPTMMSFLVYGFVWK